MRKYIHTLSYVTILCMIGLLLHTNYNIHPKTLTLLNNQTTTAYKNYIKINYPILKTKKMFHRTYKLYAKTEHGAGIYVNEKDNRATPYVIQALNEAGISNSMTDFHKIITINNYLCDKFTYAEYATQEGFSYQNDWLPFTDYCLLSDHALCAGYTEAFQSMCIAVGIECYYVTGYAYLSDGSKSYHAWNRLILNKTSYYIDVCWNDSSNNAYFLSETL